MADTIVVARCAYEDKHEFEGVELRLSHTFLKDMDALIGEFGGDFLIVNLRQGVVREQLRSTNWRLTSMMETAYGEG